MAGRIARSSRARARTATGVDPLLNVGLLLAVALLLSIVGALTAPPLTAGIATSAAALAAGGPATGTGATDLSR